MISFKARIRNPGDAALAFPQPTPLWLNKTVITGASNRLYICERERRPRGGAYADVYPRDDFVLAPGLEERVDLDFRPGPASEKTIRCVLPYTSDHGPRIEARLYQWAIKRVSWAQGALRRLGWRYPELMFGECLLFEVEVPAWERLEFEAPELDYSSLQAR